MNRLAIDKTKIRPKEELIIALSDLDFSWYPAEVEQVKELWQKGIGTAEIAKKFSREVDEVFLLLLDLARQGEIRSREGGLYGRESGAI